MAAQRYSFDIQTRHGGRWIIDSVETQDQAARKRAATLFANPKCAGARIVRTWTRPDGVEVDTEIFCQTREVEEDTTLRITRIGAIEGPCRTPEDFAAYDGRQAMARIFRDYLNQVILTPTEILHDFRQLKRISEKDSLIRDAIDLVAGLQAREGEQDSSARRDEIYKMLDAMLKRARAIDTASLPKLDGTLGEAMRTLGAVAPEQRNYLALAGLSRELGKLPSWLGKLEKLCAMVAVETDAQALGLLDGVIADLLGTDVVDELLGFQPHLGARIRAMFDLADGVAPTTRTGAGAETASLCLLLAANRLPASRRCLAARAHRALRLPQPLKPHDPEMEGAEFQKLVARLVRVAGLHSGPETAQALTLRFARSLEQGGKPGRRAAIKGVFQAMPDLARGVIYLCDLARSDLAAEHLPDMAELFGPVLTAKGFDEFCSRELEIKQRMECATAAYHALAGSPFAPGIKSAINGHIDDLLEHFVVGEKIIEKLDLPSGHLRDRAFRLIRFCCSGLLPDGKALAKARARVLALLKQPDFTSRFVAGLADQQAAQAALRDFFALLKSSGVQGG